MKLAAELARPSTGKTLYLLDEPTTGLHFDDIRKLLEVLHRLVDLGNTVIVGRTQPRRHQNRRLGHRYGARKPAFAAARSSPCGTPEEVVRQFETGAPTHTGRILKGILEAGPHAERPKFDPEGRRCGPRIGDMDIAEVGKEHKLPWEADGPKWHTQRSRNHDRQTDEVGG